MLHAVCRPPLAPSEMLACVPPSLVTYLPMALATPVRAAPVDLLTRPKVNPVTAWLRMNDICRQGEVVSCDWDDGSGHQTEEPDDPQLKKLGRQIIYFVLLLTSVLVAWQKIYDWFIE